MSHARIHFSKTRNNLVIFKTCLVTGSHDVTRFPSFLYVMRSAKCLSSFPTAVYLTLTLNMKELTVNSSNLRELRGLQSIKFSAV